MTLLPPTSGRAWVRKMIKKITVLAVVFCLLLAVFSPILVQAETEPTILESSAEAEFPYYLDFKLEAESNVKITDIRLNYRVNRDSFARVTSEVIIKFIPDTSVAVNWTWDMIKSGGLPSGSIVEYWWTVTDADDNRVETTTFQIQFNDERYTWLDLTEGDITLYWYQGDESFARQIMDAAQEALARLATDTGAYLERPVRVYIYASYEELRGAMIFPQEWTGGVAYTTYGTMAIGIDTGNLEWGKRTVVHELTHLVTHQMTSNPYSSLPVWLNEGLSMYAEGEMESIFEVYLIQAVSQDSLISVRSLASPFSAYADKSYLSYAQSQSLVEFLIDTYGQSKIFEILSVFKKGSSYDGALIEVYGFDMDGLDALWRDYIIGQYQPATTNVSNPAKAVTLSTLATTLLLALGLVAERWSWSRG